MAAIRLRSWLDASPPLRPAARASSEENSCAEPFSWAALPPLLPACLASSGLNSWADPLAWAAWPPLLAISRCLNSSMEPKPRLPLGICSLLSTGPVLGRRTHQVILRFPALGTGSAAINLADMFRRVSSLETDRAESHTVDQAGIEHVQQEQNADDGSRDHDRHPIRYRRPMPLKKGHRVSAGVLAGVDADANRRQDQEQQE